MSKREYDFQDDGRVVADMSGLEKPSPFGFLFRRRAPRQPQEPSVPGGQPPQPSGEPLTPRQRRITIWAAVSAGLVTALIYIVGLGLVTLLLLWLWT